MRPMDPIQLSTRHEVLEATTEIVKAVINKAGDSYFDNEEDRAAVSALVRDIYQTLAELHVSQ